MSEGTGIISDNPYNRRSINMDVPFPMPPELALPNANEPDPIADSTILDIIEMSQQVDVSVIAMATADTTQERHRWRIESDDQAEWAMRKLVKLRAARDRIIDQANVWLSRIDEWRDDLLRTDRVIDRMGFFEAHLADYALRLRQVDPSRKTFKFPSGKVTTTAYQPKARITDEGAVLAWARSLPDAEREAVVQVTEKVLVTPFRAVLELVEVADRVVLTCGEEVPTNLGRMERAGEAWAPDTLGTIWIGDGVVCPSCSCDAIVGDVTQSHLTVQHPQLGDVPGVVVESGGLHINVVPDVN